MLYINAACTFNTGSHMDNPHFQDLRSTTDVVEIGAAVDKSKGARVKKQMKLNGLRSKNPASLTEKEEKESGVLRADLKKNLRKLFESVKSVEKKIRSYDKKAGSKELSELEADLDKAVKKESAVKTIVKDKKAAMRAAKADIVRIQKSGSDLTKQRKKAEASLNAGRQRLSKQQELKLWQAEVAEAGDYVDKM